MGCSRQAVGAVGLQCALFGRKSEALATLAVERLTLPAWQWQSLWALYSGLHDGQFLS